MYRQLKILNRLTGNTYEFDATGSLIDGMPSIILPLNDHRWHERSSSACTYTLCPVSVRLFKRIS